MRQLLHLTTGVRMRFNIGVSISAATALLMGCSLNGVANSADTNGETLYTDLGCVYCHGPAGREPVLPDYPKLAGQNREYLVQQVLDIKSRARDNGYTGMMQPAILNISDDDIAAIAAYLAGQ